MGIMVTSKPIRFHRMQDAYGEFSNLFPRRIEVYGREWASAEHAFQAMKFHKSPPYMERVAEADTPSKAARFGKSRTFPLRADWDHVLPEPTRLNLNRSSLINDGFEHSEPPIHRVKDLIMFEVCKAKFKQPDLSRVLLATGDRPLIEDTARSGDAYWGYLYSKKEGANKLGRILMLVRSHLSSHGT